MDSRDLKQFLNECIEYYERVNLNQIREKEESKEQWKKFALDSHSFFHDTDFFFNSLEILKTEKTSKKFYFLKVYKKLLQLNAFDVKPKTALGPIDKILYDLADVSIIFGRRLIISNGTKIDQSSSFNKEDFMILPKGLLVGYEFAPIVEGGINMWLSLKQEWGDDFEEKYFEAPNSDGVRFSTFTQHPAYIKFVKDREELIDHYVASGRISNTDLAW